jgi:hypothetical protein
MQHQDTEDCLSKSTDSHVQSSLKSSIANGTSRQQDFHSHVNCQFKVLKSIVEKRHCWICSIWTCNLCPTPRKHSRTISGSSSLLHLVNGLLFPDPEYWVKCQSVASWSAQSFIFPAYWKLVGTAWSLKNVADKGLAECAYSWHDFMVQSRCTYILRCWRGKNPRCQGASYGTPKNQRDKNVRSILFLLLLLLLLIHGQHHFSWIQRKNHEQEKNTSGPTHNSILRFSH